MSDITLQWLKTAVLYEISASEFTGIPEDEASRRLENLTALGVDTLLLKDVGSDPALIPAGAAEKGLRCVVGLTGGFADPAAIKMQIRQLTAAGAAGFACMENAADRETIAAVSQMIREEFPETAFIVRKSAPAADTGSDIGNLTAALTSPGIAIIQSGDEIGIRAPGSSSLWETAEAMKDVENSLWQKAGLLIRFRRRLPALRSDAPAEVITNGDPLICCRGSEDQKILIVIRKENQPWQCRLPMPEVRGICPLTGTWIRADFPEDGIIFSGEGTECGVFLILRTLKN